MSVEPFLPSEPIKHINDPHVQAIGRLAVDEHNKKTGDNLKPMHVVNGLSGTIFLPGFEEGVFYHLVVEAETTGGINWTYATKVLKISGGCLIRYEFKYFEPILPYKP